MSQIPRDKPLAMMTAGELIELIDAHLAEKLGEPAKQEPQEPDTIYGLQGMADRLHVNIRTFSRWRDSGIFDGVIERIGRHYWCKAEALEKAATKASRKMNPAAISRPYIIININQNRNEKNRNHPHEPPELQGSPRARH